MPIERRVLVIGGTGLVGTPIVRRLERAGWRVRVMSRNAADRRAEFPGIELVSGDAGRAEDVTRAMAGCRAVLICVSDLGDPYLDLRVTKNVLAAAEGTSVDRIGLISGASVAQERRGFPMIDAKFQAEALVRAGETPWVILRLTWPMESLARFVRGNRATILGRQPATIHPVAGDDIGRMVAAALELDEAIGHTFTIHGPEAFTMRSWLERYCALRHSPARVGNVPLWVLSAMAFLTRNTELKAVVPLMRYFEGLPEFGDPEEANRILGAPTTTLEQWVEATESDASAQASKPEVAPRGREARG